MPPTFGRNNFNYNKGYEDGLKWGVYDYNCFPGPDYDAGFMAGYFEREGRPFDGETYTQREQARKQAQYQSNSYYAQKIFGAINPITIRSTALLKSLAFLVIITIISSVSSLFDGHKSSNNVNNHINNNYQQEKVNYSENTGKQLTANSLVGNIEPEKEEVVNNTTSTDETTETFTESDFEPYMRELQRRIKLNWVPAVGNEDKIVEVIFKIAKDGRLLSCKIIKSSGLEQVDRAAVEAIRMTAPFKQLPSGFKGDSIDIQFTFDYHKVER